MVRTYVKKRSKPEFSEDDMQRAIDAVKKKELSLRKAAQVYGVTHTALFYRLKKIKNCDAQPESREHFSSKHSFRQVFTNEQEELLVSYIIKCSRMNYGLTYKILQNLAYEYALRLKRKFPENWNENKTAGIDWVKGFMKRHQNLSLRKPENTSLSRGTSFNKANVMVFYDNLYRALGKHPFKAERIYNLDETGVTTVVQAPNVIAAKGVKQVGQAVSGERGSLVTMVGIVNASGNALPPVFIFPRARFHETFMIGAPPGSLGLVNSPSSGWMTASLFLKTLEHLVSQTRCSKQDPILLLMDNHESHCSLEAVIYAKENGIIIVTFPPHCTHRLQPLDVSVMGPFKAKYKVAQNDWMLSHPGKAITIHNIAYLAGKAFENSFTMKNITAGFRKPGIYPLDRNAFSDEDFDAAFVTDRPSVSSPAPQESVQVSLPLEEIPTSSTFPQAPHDLTLLPDDNSLNVSVESVRPFPKAPPRAENSRGRKRGKSKILTETPEKNALEQQMIDKKKKVKVTKKVLEDVETSSSNDSYSVHDDSDGPLSEGSLDEDYHMEVRNEDLFIGDFIVVKFCTKKTIVHFVGQIIEKNGDELQVKFLRRKGLKFYFPLVDDISTVEIEDVLRKLSSPLNIRGTDRTQSLISFNFNQSVYNFR